MLGYQNSGRLRRFDFLPCGQLGFGLCLSRLGRLALQHIEFVHQTRQLGAPLFHYPSVLCLCLGSPLSVLVSSCFNVCGTRQQLALVATVTPHSYHWRRSPQSLPQVPFATATIATDAMASLPHYHSHCCATTVASLPNRHPHHHCLIRVAQVCNGKNTGRIREAWGSLVELLEWKWLCY